MFFGLHKSFWALIAVAAVGCTLHDPAITFDDPTPQPRFDDSFVSQANFEEPTLPAVTARESIQPPLSLDQPDAEPWKLSLDEAIQIALSNSTVLRDLGARVIQAPELTRSVYGPSLQATDPEFGIESALSEFDANFATRAFFEKNDLALNNALLGGGTNFFQQDLWRIQSELKKKAATGTEFSLRHNIQDDLNNAPRNLFGTDGFIHGHAWDWNAEVELRQPLLLGSGTEFNRIAGRELVPGVANGVIIARLNTNISVADFRIALRNFVSNVENAYWDLYFAYRDLQAKKTGRDRTLDTYRQLQNLQEEGRPGAEEDKVAQAAEQFFRFEQDVEDALSGRLVDGTRDFNGSTGGTFQGVSGVFVNERRLRLIMGVPISDGRLIRPVTTPCEAEVVFSWDDLVAKSLAQRVELTRQQLRVRRREYELIANRNFLLPRLDVVGRYRWRGLGNRLYDARVPYVQLDDFINVDSSTSEWQVGLEYSSTIGFRRAASAVRNSELDLARERAILRETERQIVHDVSNSVADKERAFRVLQTSRNRRIAAERQLTILTDQAVRDATRVDFNLLLDSQRRAMEAQIDYYRSLTAYAVTLKNVYLEMGGLMDYCNIRFSEDSSAPSTPVNGEPILETPPPEPVPAETTASG